MTVRDFVKVERVTADPEEDAACSPDDKKSKAQTELLPVTIRGLFLQHAYEKSSSILVRIATGHGSRPSQTGVSVSCSVSRWPMVARRAGSRAVPGQPQRFSNVRWIGPRRRTTTEMPTPPAL